MRITLNIKSILIKKVKAKMTQEQNLHGNEVMIVREGNFSTKTV